MTTEIMQNAITTDDSTITGVSSTMLDAANEENIENIDRFCCLTQLNITLTHVHLCHEGATQGKLVLHYKEVWGCCLR